MMEIGPITVRDHMSFEQILQILGAVVPLMSAVASFLNHLVRLKKESGSDVSPMLAGSGAVLNVGALNLDKALQLMKMLKEAKAAEPKAEEPPAP